MHSESVGSGLVGSPWTCCCPKGRGQGLHFRSSGYMMQGCHTPPPPPTPWYPLRPPCGVGPVVVPFPAPPVVSLLWWAVPLALFAVVPAAGGTAHDVVLQTATRVDNRIIFDIMLNIIIVVVIFIISTIKEQLPPSPSPYNPHD